MKFERYRKHPEFRTVIKLTFDDREIERGGAVAAFLHAVLSTVEFLIRDVESADVDITDHGESRLVGSENDVQRDPPVSEYGSREGPSPADSPR